MRRFFILFILGVLGLCGCNTGEKRLSIVDAWARPGSVGGNSAIYFTIENPTSQDDTLLSASSNVAKAVELHLSKMDESGDMMMMQQDKVPVPAGEKVEFKPGGLHVMLIDLTEELKVDDSFTVTLNFEKQGALTVDVKVKNP